MFIYHFFKSHVSYTDNKSKNKEINKNIQSKKNWDFSGKDY